MGPLAGLRIIELAGLGPAPFAAMMLADHGAEVIRVDPPHATLNLHDPLLRSRRFITLDLKQADDVERLRVLARTADALLEGYRPGVMERLGLGPDILLGDNPKLVYGRMTGWGQHGPLAATAGHDINYIAISGVLGMLGRADEKPTPPINLAGDFGGGAMMLAFGMLAALLHVRAGGSGQVVDASMTDGSALLSAMMWGFRNDGSWQEQRGTNIIDTGAPFYDSYETADGQFIAVGAIEPKFHAELLRRMGLAADSALHNQQDRAKWPEQKQEMAALFKSRSRDEWVAIMADSDACVAPILSMSEALDHPHNVARRTFISVGGEPQPAPAPHYSATPCHAPCAPRPAGSDNDTILTGPGAGQKIKKGEDHGKAGSHPSRRPPYPSAGSSNG